MKSLKEMAAEFQATLPPEDRVWNDDQEPCNEEDDGYHCTKAQEHQGDHIAHGYLRVEHRWRKSC